MAVTSFATASGVALPEGTKALITQGLSSDSAYTYTPSSALPIGSYMLTANPCQTVYAEVNGKQFKSDTGSIAFTVDSAASSVKFKADQKLELQNIDAFEAPNPLHYSYTYNSAALAQQIIYLGASLGVHYGINYSTGQGSNILYRSLDKVHWETTFTQVDNAYQDQPFRNLLATIGNITVVAGSYYTVVSYDGGISWKRWVHNIGFQALTYGNGLFVAFYNNNVWTSTNGYTWTDRGVKTSYSQQAVIFDGTKFIAASYGYVYTSTDGIAWTLSTSSAGNTNYACYNLAYNGSNLYMLIDNAGNTYTSPDATTWTAKTAFGSGTPRNLIWFNGKFAAIAYGAVRTFRTTTDGASWADFTFTTQFGLNTIQSIRWWKIDTINNEVFLFSETSNGTSYIAYGASADLSTWRTWSGANSRGAFQPFLSAKVGNDYYFADYYSMYKTSDLGKTWTAWTVLTSTAYNLQAFTYADGKFFGIGQQNGITYSTYWWSNDAITWTYSGVQVMNGYFTSAFSDGKYLYTITNSNQYAMRLASNGTYQTVYLGTSTQAYFAGVANGITFYFHTGYLFWLDWDAQSGYQYGNVISDYGTSSQSVSSDVRVFYLNGHYVLISQTTGATGTIQHFKAGRTHNRLPINIATSNNTKFIGEINNTLYFLTSKGTTTYNTGELYPVMKVTNIAAKIAAGTTNNVFELTGQEERFLDFSYRDAAVNQVDNVPYAGLAFRYSGTEFQGIAIMRKKPTVFSLYSVTDTVYN